MNSRWERIDSLSDRLRIPQGWIVRSWAGLGNGVHMIIVIDATHTWVLDEK